jgi:hypothetical protein
MVTGVPYYLQPGAFRKKGLYSLLPRRRYVLGSPYFAQPSFLEKLFTLAKVNYVIIINQ